MAIVQILDKYYLFITLIITTGYQLVGFVVAWTMQFDKITDFTGASNFFILSLLTLLMGNTFHTRNVVTSILVMVWATRLGGFLLFRVLKRGKDARFDRIRSQFFPFLAFWVAQILWVWVVSIPLVILNSPAISDLQSGGSNPAFGTSRDVAGIIIWSLGWLYETIGDFQKHRFATSEPRKDALMQSGLWHYSRHPPYFGEILCWWGIWILALSPTTDGDVKSETRHAQYAAVVSPVFTMLVLMFGSGIPTAEKPLAKRFYLLAYGPGAEIQYRDAWGYYTEYLNATSILIPMPRSIYRKTPMFIKRTVLFDFPLYQFDVVTDGAAVIDEQREVMKNE